MKGAIVDAGTAVVILLGLFLILTAISVAMTVFGIAGDILVKSMEWAALVLAALLGFLGGRQTTRDETAKNDKKGDE